MSAGRQWAALLLAFALLPAWGEGLRLPAPGPKDTCPVCGMFVSLYPDWVATVLYKDGHAHLSLIHIYAGIQSAAEIGFRIQGSRIPSFPRMRESSQPLKNGIPAFAGMTN